ncbi:dipeptidase [candidate division KSB1 bacterium]
MYLKRRDFLKLMPVSILAPKQLVNNHSFTARNDPAAIPFQSGTRHTQDSSEIDKLYKNAIVIDALIIARDWDEDWLKAVEQSGYTGLQTSLSSGNLTAALNDLDRWDKRIQDNPDKLIKAVTAADIERAKREGKLAMMFGFQNATMIGNRIDNLQKLYDSGTRWIQLTYNTRNLLGDGCTERTNAGLSDFGVAAVERMNELGIIVDLSHCGRQTTMDGIQFSDPGPCFTHTMCESLYPDHPRSKTDEQIKAMADKGGVMGIIGLGYMIGPDPGGETTIETHADHIDHAVKVAGIDHVGLASDFSIHGISPGATRENWYVPRLTSFKPSYQVRWPPWLPGLESPERYKNVAHVLDRRGYRSEHIEKILGLNWLRYYRDVLRT